MQLGTLELKPVKDNMQLIADTTKSALQRVDSGDVYVACMILATDRADVNGVIRKTLDARRISFAPMDKAVSLSNMEYGGITPIGLPESWSVLVDRAVVQSDRVVVGSGTRNSKLVVSGTFLAELPNAKVLDIAQSRTTDADRPNP